VLTDISRVGTLGSYLEAIQCDSHVMLIDFDSDKRQITKAVHGAEDKLNHDGINE